MWNSNPAVLDKNSAPSSASGTSATLAFRAVVPDTHSNAGYSQHANRTDGLNAGSWSHSKRKRAFDLLCAAAALVVSSPVLLLTAIAVKLSSSGPVLFRQTRIGKGGREFTIYKFRTMRAEGSGPAVTKAGDVRLTSIGAALRRLKLDELPQLFNVVKGDMSFVGARPKVPHHQTYLLRHRPGITGPSAVAFRKEEEMLHHVPHHALDAYQVHVLMPLKMELDERYMSEATFSSDLRLIANTVLGRGKTVDPDTLGHLHRELFSLSLATAAPVPESQGISPETVRPLSLTANS